MAKLDTNVKDLKTIHKPSDKERERVKFLQKRFQEIEKAEKMAVKKCQKHSLYQNPDCHCRYRRAESQFPIFSENRPR